MSRIVRRGPGPSSTLVTPDRAGNVVGVDPHKRTLTATVVDPRGGVLASEHFRVSGDGHRALEAWARQFGQIVRWGIEGASAWGRHTAIFLVSRGYDVRDVCPNRTGRQDRARQRGKSDTLDCERIARETLAHPLLPRAFKRSGDAAGPDEQTELLSVWWKARRSLLKSRQHLLSEAEALLDDLPIALIEHARAALWTVDRVRRGVAGRGRRPAPVHRRRVRTLQRDRAVGGLDRGGARRAGPPPPQPRRQPARERDPVPDRDHPAALRPRAQALYANARAHGRTKKEARRILKRHLSDVVYRRMIRDLPDHDTADPRLVAA